MYNFVEDFDQETLKFDNSDIVRAVQNDGKVIITEKQVVLENRTDDFVEEVMRNSEGLSTGYYLNQYWEENSGNLIDEKEEEHHDVFQRNRNAMLEENNK